ncbi:MAG: hypothetical protein AAF316_00565 [Cyanobacteria bacterium P01_A01_bin.80]
MTVSPTQQQLEAADYAVENFVLLTKALKQGFNLTEIQAHYLAGRLMLTLPGIIEGIPSFFEHVNDTANEIKKLY